MASKANAIQLREKHFTRSELRGTSRKGKRHQMNLFKMID